MPDIRASGESNRPVLIAAYYVPDVREGGVSPTLIGTLEAFSWHSDGCICPALAFLDVSEWRGPNGERHPKGVWESAGTNFWVFSSRRLSSEGRRAVLDALVESWKRSEMIYALRFSPDFSAYERLELPAGPVPG